MALIEIESLCFKKKEGQRYPRRGDDVRYSFLGTYKIHPSRGAARWMDGWMDGWMKDYLAR